MAIFNDLTKHLLNLSYILMSHKRFTGPKAQFMISQNYLHTASSHGQFMPFLCQRTICNK